MSPGKNNLNQCAGSIKVCLVQMEIVPGRPVLNTRNMLDSIESAKRDSADLIVFPELAVPGSALGNRLNNESFLRECEECGDRIREASAGTVIVFGNAAVDWTRRNNDGRVRKYNALFVAEDGLFSGPVNGPYPFVVKNMMPGGSSCENEAGFYDIASLALEQGCTVERLISPVHAGNYLLGCMACGGLPAGRFAATMTALCRHPVNLVVAADSSPFLADAGQEEKNVLSSQAAAILKPLVYVNSAGILNNGKIVRICAGRSCVYDGSGGLAARLDAFRGDVGSFDIPLSGAAGFKAPFQEERDGIGLICEALLSGVSGFSKQLGIRRAVVGVSGGIDSAVVAGLCREALGRDNVLLVNMPSRFVSRGGMELALELAANLGCYYATLPIDESVDLTSRQVSGLEISTVDGRLKERLCLDDAMMENVQARDRSTRVLAALAAAFGGAFTCNANKSEATAGYSTFYGDAAGYLAPIADLWKGEAYALARHLNDRIFRRAMIPPGCFERKPSAELGPGQNADEGKGDPLIYPYHDRLFRTWVEWPEPASPADILGWYADGDLPRKIGFDGSIEDIFSGPEHFIEDLERWWTQFQGIGSAKRVQAPPVLAVKERPLGAGPFEPQLGPWFAARYEELKKRVVNH